MESFHEYLTLLELILGNPDKSRPVELVCFVYVVSAGVHVRPVDPVLEHAHADRLLEVVGVSEHDPY